MEFVVLLALIVLVAVFLFSLWMLVVTCQRRNNYRQMVKIRALRFSNLRNQNADDLAHLGPNMLKTLNDNQWINDFAAGLLQNCVAVLRLCHTLTERMLPLEQPNSNQYSSQIDQLICEASNRLMPNFESLLRALASPNVDIRVLEARTSALVSACWALAMPVCLANFNQKEILEEILNKMNIHLRQLQNALDQFEEEEHQQILKCKNSTKFPLKKSLNSPQQNHISETTFTLSETLNTSENQTSSLLPEDL